MVKSLRQVGNDSCPFPEKGRLETNQVQLWAPMSLIASEPHHVQYTLPNLVVSKIERFYIEPPFQNKIADQHCEKSN